MHRAREACLATLALVLLVGGPAAAAQIVALSPPVQGVAPGAQLSLALEMDFDEPTVGGGVEIGFDPAALELVAFAFDGALGDDPALRLFCPGAAPGCGAFDGPGLLVAFGQITGLAGSRVVGELTFRALALGSTAVTLGPNDAPAGPFFSAASGLEQDVSFAGATVQVPEPATLALVAAGLLALGARPARYRITSKPSKFGWPR